MFEIVFYKNLDSKNNLNFSDKFNDFLKLKWFKKIFNNSNKH